MALLGALRTSSLARLCLVCAACLAGARAQGGRAEGLEDAVKATYVYKFAPFVTWPASHSGAFTICTLGADHVTALLPQAVAGQQVGGRPIKVVATRAGETDGCEIVYLAESETDSVADAFRGKAVLTVTTSAHHGIIRLVTVEHHVRFDIDTALAAEGGLTISSKLLELARNVAPRRS
jgi:hypothetical protein